MTTFEVGRGGGEGLHILLTWDRAHVKCTSHSGMCVPRMHSSFMVTMPVQCRIFEQAYRFAMQTARPRDVLERYMYIYIYMTVNRNFDHFAHLQ